MTQLPELIEKKIDDYQWKASLTRLMEKYPEEAKYQIKSSADQEYFAFFATANLECPCDKIGDCEICQGIYQSDFYRRNEYNQPQLIFSVPRNRYRTDWKGVSIEFVSDRIFLANIRHGEISVCQIEGDSFVELHTDQNDDKFIYTVEVINEGKHMIADVWYWAPFYGTLLYDLEKLISTPDYCPVTLEEYGDDEKYEEREKAEVSEGMITFSYQDYYRKIYSCQEVLDRSEEIFEDFRNIIAVKNYHQRNNNIFQQIFQGKDFEQTTVIVKDQTKLIDDRNLSGIACWGNTSEIFFNNKVDWWLRGFRDLSDGGNLAEAVVMQITGNTKDNLPFPKVDLSFIFTTLDGMISTVRFYVPLVEMEWLRVTKEELKTILSRNRYDQETGRTYQYTEDCQLTIEIF